MKVRLKEDPREWRKSTLLTVLGLAMISSLLCWRRVLTVPTWTSVLAVFAFIGLLACLQPRWLRGYYRISTRVSFWLSQVVARVALALIFLLLILPLGVILRLAGKDLLHLKRTPEAGTYWSEARKSNSLDQLF